MTAPDGAKRQSLRAFLREPSDAPHWVILLLSILVIGFAVWNLVMLHG